MDFNYLLELAEMNKKKTEETPGKFLSSKLSNPKKERPAPKGSAIKAFLDKKEDDKKKADDDYKKQRDDLLFRRSQDKHSKKRMHTMINRTKGASKAVLDEAKDLITANGEEQCDEDDYGYESLHSQSIFNKLTTKYKEAPKDKRLNINKASKGNMADIKSRVMSSLKQEQEESLGIRKRHRKRKSRSDGDDFINDGDSYKKFKGAHSSASSYPVMHHNKIHKPEKPKEVKRKVSKGPPPMTYQQLMKEALKKSSEPTQPIEIPDVPVDKADEVQGRLMTAKEKQDLEDERLRKLRRLGKLPKEQKSDPKSSTCTKSDKKSSPPEEPSKDTKKSIKKEPKQFDRSKYFAVPSASKPPTTNGLSKPKAVPVRAHPAERPKASTNPKPNKHSTKSVPNASQRTIYDEESEDSDMDDFIDDGEAEVDFSSEIGKIFGYNKAKYSNMNEDEDDASMEASYSQLEQEEKRSTKFGIMEDLEDMKREEIEKKQKLQRKKMAMKARR